MNLFKLALTFLLTITITTSCGRKTAQVSGVYAYSTPETVCIANQGDGTIVLRAWGTGANKAQAIEQAQKNALMDVIYNGIKSGQISDPLILEINAKEKFRYYFEPFFSKNGEYKNYVSVDDVNKDSRIEAKATSRNGHSVIVVVNRSALRERLINDNIIKP